MQVSPSGLARFGTCARQYYYEVVLGLGKEERGSLTVLGTVWHYAIEVYENYGYDLDLAKRTFAYYWDHPDQLGERIDFWHRQTSREGLLKRGLSMLEQYHELKPWTEGKLIGTEIRFKVPLGDHVLKGFIDKLFARPGQRKLEIIDFKTGSYVPEKLRQNLQFTSYCYATMRPEFWVDIPGFEDGHVKFEGWKRNGWWYHARNNKMFNAGFRGEVDYKRLLLAATEMDRAITANVFPLDISGASCGYCPFVEKICGSEMLDPVTHGRI